MHTIPTLKTYVACLLLTAFVSGTLLIALPTRTEAGYEFGGQISMVINCKNNVVWARIGAPRGGDYIWVPGITRTYMYGKPTHTGQWLLGTKAPPYFCIVTIWPIVVFGGTMMAMLGSSQ